MKFLLYSLSLPKRHVFAHWLYRRMYRAYAWFIRVINPSMTMRQFFILMGLGPIVLIVILASLLTLMIP